MKIKKKILFSIILILGIYVTLNFFIGNKKLVNFKNYFTDNQKNIIKEIFFPHKKIKELKKTVDNLSKKNKELYLREKRMRLSNELDLRNNLEVINFQLDKKSNKIFKISNKPIEYLKYNSKTKFYFGINNYNEGSHASFYVDKFENNLFILSSFGILAHTNFPNVNETIKFTPIKTNLDSFLDSEDIVNGHLGSVSYKDIFIVDQKIYISFTNKINKNCWNTSVLEGKINYNYVSFEKFFEPKQCIDPFNMDDAFATLQSGGRIVEYNKNNILLSIGDYKNRSLAQDKNSIFGKVLKINLINKDYKIVSMGHRNIQGLYYDKKKDYMIMTEHGPKGGDEININKNPLTTLKNYGWPISSYGDHYGNTESNIYKFRVDKYPLRKSHKKYNFEEPIKYFNPSIAPSEVVKINENKFVIGSMKNNYLYFLELDSDLKLKNLQNIELSERIRDLNYDKKSNILFLTLEKTPSLAIIDLNNFN